MDVSGDIFPESAAATRVHTALIPERALRVSGTRRGGGGWWWGGIAAAMRCGGGWPAPSGCNLQRCALLFKTLRVFFTLPLLAIALCNLHKKGNKKAFANFLFHNMATVTHLKIGHTEVQCIIFPVVSSCSVQKKHATLSKL